MRINRIAGIHIEDSDNLKPLEAELAAAARCSDDDLADVIAEYGVRVCPTDLTVLLRAIPGLENRPVALDAAIEMVLRGRCLRGASMQEACDALVREHPHLAKSIRTAAALNRVMGASVGPDTPVAKPEASLPRLTGRFLDDRQPRYALHERIGEGSEAVVYLAVDRAFSDPDHPAWVAIKRSRVCGLTTSLGTSDESERARRVVHPNVVRVLDRFVDDEGHVCHVFEYVRGGTLASWRTSFPGSVPAREATAMVRRIAAGVQAVHAVGLVHRDIKPSNVLIAENGTPKITDFGISRQQDWGPGIARQGSLAFVAPEQFRGGASAVTVAADVYGLGGLLYWLLTDRYPNASVVEGAAEYFSGPDQDAPSPAARRPGIDPDLDAICRKALAPRPEDRYASADSLALDLDRWLRFEPLSWRTTPVRRQVALLFRRHPRSLPAACAALAIGAGTLAMGVLAWTDSRVRDVQLELEAERQAREAERLKDLDARSKIVDYVVQMIRSDRNPDSPSHAWLNAVTFLESVVGPTIVSPELPVELWQERIDVAERLLAKAEAEGRRNELEFMLLESCLCVWLLNNERPQEALTRLGSLRERWAGRLDPRIRGSPNSVSWNCVRRPWPPRTTPLPPPGVKC